MPVFFPQSNTLYITLNIVLTHEEYHYVFQSSDVEQKLSVMEAQIDSLLCGLQRLGALEARLEELASRTNTEKVRGHFFPPPV